MNAKRENGAERWRTASRRLAILLACCVVLHSEVVWAQAIRVAPRGGAKTETTASKTPLPAELPFRRVFAPAAKADHWPLGPGRYLPVEAETFARLVEAAHVDPASRGAQLMAAEYAARLVDGEVLSGTARWQILLPGREPALLRLEPCNLTIDEAHWVGEEDVQPAVVGTGAQGKLAAVVESAGTLECPWSSSGDAIGSAALGFHLELPESPINRLLLDLPSRMYLLVDHGVVARADGAPEGYGRWRIESGGQNRLNLRVMGEEATAERKQLVLVHQASTYAVSQRGMEIISELRLDVHNEALQKLTIRLEPGVHLIGAKLGEAALPWTTSVAAPDQPCDATLQFAEPILGSGRIVRVSALAPLADESLHRLPGLVPAGTFWQEGTATVLIADPLKLLDLQLHGARQTGASPLAGPQSGESIEVQYFRPDAAIDIAVGRPPGSLELASGTQVLLSGTGVTSSSVFEITASGAERFVLRAALADEWTIERVESQTTQRVADWHVAELSDRQRNLVVRLDEPVSPQRPLRLLVGARRSAGADARWTPKDLLPITLAGVQVRRPLLAVGAADPWQLGLAGDLAAIRLDASKLAVADASLFAAPAAGEVFVVDDSAADLEVRLLSGQTALSASWELQATVRTDRLDQTARVNLTPRAGSVDRLIVHFSTAHPQPWNWSVAGEEGAAASGALLPRRLSADEQATMGVGEPGETWEVRLRTPRSGPFDIVAARTQPLAPQQPIALATLLGVDEQSGLVSVGSSESLGLALSSKHLKVVPLEDDSSEPDRRVRYRYDPRRDALAPKPILIVSSSPLDSPLPDAWAWSFQLETRFADGAPAVHLATWRLENTGRGGVQISLPEDAELAEVSVNGRSIPAGAASSKRSTMEVLLPVDQRWVTVRGVFITPPAPSGWTTRVVPPAVAIDLPILHRQWKFHCPEGYEIVSSGSPSAADGIGSTWSQRLFGPLGRGSRGQMFDPIAPSHWSSARAPNKTDSAGTVLLARWCAVLDRALAASERSTATTWGELFESCWLPGGEKPQHVIVDVASFTAEHFDLQSRLPTFERRLRGPEGALDVLRQAGLVVCATQQSIGITTHSAASSWGPAQSLSRTPLGLALGDGPVAQALDQAQITPTDEWAPADRWRSGRPNGEVRWPSLAGSNWVPPEASGRTYAFALGERTPTEIMIGGSITTASRFWAIALALVSLGAWRRRRNPAHWCLLCAVAGGLSLIGPAAWSLVLAPVFTGALCCLALDCLRRRAPIAAAERSSIAKRQTPAVVEAGLFLWVALGLSSSIGAAEVQQAQESIPAVFVPVDSKGQPAGERLQVPEELFRELHRRAAAGSGKPEGWLIRHATYRGTLTRDATLQRWRVGELRAAFDLTTFEPGLAARLPISKSAASGNGSALRLDGRIIAPVWTNDASELEVVLADAGAHRLEMTLPVATNAAGIDLPVPIANAATIEWTAPADAPLASFPSARGPVAVRDAAGIIRAELGPSDRLQINWQEGSTVRGSQAADIDVLLWMHVHAGSVALQVRLNCKPPAGQPIDNIRLLTDARLRLLPSTSADAPRVITSSVGDRRTIELQPDRAISEPGSIDLGFLLTSTSGLGNLRVPELELANAVVGRRLLAVSVDPALEFDEQRNSSPPQLRPLAAAEFVAAWGGPSDQQPQLAYEIEDADPGWVLATRPRQSRLTCEPTLIVSVGRQTALAEWYATIDHAADQYQLRLMAPPDLQIAKLSAIIDGVNQVSRWSRTVDGQVVVSLGPNHSDRLELSLEGQMPCPGEGTWKLPGVQLLEANELPGQLDVYAQPSTVVIAPAELESLPGAVAGMPGGWGSLVGSFRAPQEPATVVLQYNTIQGSGRLVTTMGRDDAGWFAGVDATIELSQGRLDALRLTIPPQWTEPFTLDQPGDWKVDEIPGSRDRMLIVRPHSAIGAGKPYVISLRGKVVAAAGERLRVPEINLASLHGVERFVALPRQVEQQSIVWEKFGLLSASLNDDAIPHLPAGEFDVYRALGDRFEAALQASESAKGVPQVRLADIVLWRELNQCGGVASFTIDPADADRCTIDLPTGQRPLAIYLNGAAAVWANAGPGKLRVALLGSQRLPQCLEVLFIDSNDAAPDGSYHWPTIDQFRCERTLLTVCRSATAVTGSAVRAKGSLDDWRWISAAQSVALAVENAADQSPEQLHSWVRHWQPYCDWLAGRTQDAAGGGQAANNPADETVAEVNAGLKMLQAKAPDSIESAAPGQRYLRIALDQFAGSAPLVEHAFSGKAGEYRFTASSPRPWTAWVLALLVAAGFGVLAYFFAGEAPRVSLPVAGLAIGLFGWLCLQPSFAGLLLAAASLAALLRAKTLRGAW